MRFWRRRSRAAIIDHGWIWVDREAPFRLAAEMATWPEPIDVIRDALGLPARWQRKLGFALQAVFQLIASQIPAITATDAEAARMARLMMGSYALTIDGAIGGPLRNRRKRGR